MFFPVKTIPPPCRLELCHHFHFTTKANSFIYASQNWHQLPWVWNTLECLQGTKPPQPPTPVIYTLFPTTSRRIEHGDCPSFNSHELRLRQMQSLGWVGKVLVSCCGPCAILGFVLASGRSLVQAEGFHQSKLATEINYFKKSQTS